MITPRTAQRRVLAACKALVAQRVALEDALGLVLAEDVRSRIALPPFDNSQMDGYAVRARDCARATAARPVLLRIAGAIHAGGPRPRALSAGETMAVATGGAMPRGADAVLPIEVVGVAGRNLVVRTAVARGKFVRYKGEEIGLGSLILQRGGVIHAGAVGSLAAIGCSHVRVVRAPRVTVITTGDEVIAPGRALAHGQVYDSSLPMLAALLRQAGIEPERVRRVRDSARAIESAIGDALAHSDVVITVGGVSVGPRDFVRGALPTLGVREVFWGVSQQPGRPLYFGMRGRRMVFGLPGNPASAFVCFCMHVLPALRALAGHARPVPALQRKVLMNAATANPRRWRLLRARVPDGAPSKVQVFARQGSHMSTPLGHATHLVILPPAKKGSKRNQVAAGTRVQCLPLSHAGG
ncbi:MAG: molybdopterin molybdotransferase MoeA [Candidatus Krumholzibacteria bacterium]|nr:molybdopterin molybdotransferase MoeA [Candidatus Krumholzibacteria bacterium]MDH4337649.1 molybdopterin molybdotransferase MoeA [Candidatus Krumholzibacteria bacterium]MDH5270271.1 molybdopterin molybdotransferase MoeA [Candidatus Krumholzibacteria bacterium]MDH5628418.1 molybdopterin molybdotransferase MoeA [Candidatus Krumholzibacteria bacterium]